MEANHYLLLVAHKFVKINSGGGAGGDIGGVGRG